MASVGALAEARTGATGFGTPAGRFIMVAAWMLIVFGAILHDQLPLTTWAIGPLGAGLVGALLVTHPGANKLRPALAVAAMVCAAIAGTVIFGMQLQNEMLWLYTYASYVLGALAGRGNMLTATVGSGIVWGLGAVWAWLNGAAVSGYLLVLSMPVLVVAICVTWNLALARVATRDMQYRSESERSRLAEAAAERHTASSREELAVVRREVGPLLARLAAGEPISGDFQLELRVAEARVRDRIRSPYLLHPELEAAVLQARLRGDEVILIGESRLLEPHLFEPGLGENFADGPDPEPTTGQIGNALAHAVADQLNAIEENVAITIRSMPTGSQAALSLLIRGETETHHTRFTHDGKVLTER